MIGSCGNWFRPLLLFFQLVFLFKNLSLHKHRCLDFKLVLSQKTFVCVCGGGGGGGGVCVFMCTV